MPDTMRVVSPRSRAASCTTRRRALLSLSIDEDAVGVGVGVVDHGARGTTIAFAVRP